METTVAAFEIGDKVLCLQESEYRGEEVLGVVEYVKDGWVGVRSIDQTGFRTSNLVPQRPSNLKRVRF